MKSGFTSKIIIAAKVFLFLSFIGCESDIIKSDCEAMHGTWILRDVSGGITGSGMQANFKIMVINNEMRYFLYSEKNLVSYGRIEIISQSNNDLRVNLNMSNEKGFQITGFKNVILGNDSLWMNDDCCDCFSYFFVRSDVYANQNYSQVNKSLDYLDITNYNIGFNKYFTSVYFQNENSGFITCSDGSILKTGNGGINWKITTTNNTLPLKSIAFTNENTGFAVGGLSSCGGSGCIVPGYLMLKTLDGGETWNKVDLPRNNHEFSLIKFINESTGFAIGTGIMLKTTDGGTTWKSISVQNLYAIYDMQFLNENTGFICCIKGKLFKTTDGGESWQDISLNTNHQLLSVFFINEKNGYIGLADGMISTVDGGLSWHTIEHSPGGVRRMLFDNKGNGVVFGGRSYASSEFDVWDSAINLLVNGRWYGDERVTYHMTPFCLNPRQFFTITSDNKISIIRINN